MKVSYNWLKNYIDVDVNPHDIAEILTDCGLEVEGFEEIQQIKGGLEGLVVGEVMTKEKHPDADRLNLTTIDVGSGEPLSIVCGAPNVNVGQKVVVATIGTTLYSGEDSFKIKKSKIRGQLSEGMICAEDEIGLGSSHEGIMVLEPSVEVGMLAKDYFNVQSDFVYEIGLTPNRSDATGHIGVTRDLATVLNLKNKTQLVRPSVADFQVDDNSLLIEVTVANHDLCPRYTGLTMSGLKVEESPEWLKTSLRNIGLSPINNVVDVTNFVLHETGQPLHAFDAAKITGNQVLVNTVADKTKFKTLDEVERSLSDKDLMICNSTEPMCIAGVFGGLDSGVSDQTTSIFLESAYFNPVSIRKSAKRHGLNTDASFRFERGADPNITIYALKRAANLLKEVAGGKISSDIVDLYPAKIENFEVEFSYHNCYRLIGQEIPQETIKKILTSLEIDITADKGDQLTLSIPPYRADVQREIDVIEEVLRVYGYNNVEMPSKLQSSLSYRQKPDREKIANTVADLLVSNGFSEMLSNSLTKSEYYKDAGDKLVKMLNPLSNELNVMRQTMLFNGMETIQYNQNRKRVDVKLFEFGKTYLKKENKFKETNYLSLFVSGDYYSENWNTPKELTSFYHLKGFVEALFERFGLDNLSLKRKEIDNTTFGYGLSYIINNQEIANVGLVNPACQHQFDINNEVFYAEINYDVFIKLSKLTKIKYREVSKFPSVRRDLALLVDSEVNYLQIEDLILKQDKKLIRRVNLFDVYKGKNLEKNKKSYAVSLVFSDDEKTLTDHQIDQVMNKIIKTLSVNLDVQLR